MQTKGFFGSLFDYSFSSFITSKVIKVLYVLTTIIVAIWTLVLVLVGFKSSSAAGLLMLVIIGPLVFVISMIYARIGLELLMVIFRISESVQEINERSGGVRAAVTPAPASGD